jgi:hypothetical protein
MFWAEDVDDLDLEQADGLQIASTNPLEPGEPRDQAPPTSLISSQTTMPSSIPDRQTPVFRSAKAVAPKPTQMAAISARQT